MLSGLMLYVTVPQYMGYLCSNDHTPLWGCFGQ